MNTSRKDLEQRCNEAIGSDGHVLCAILSYFPEIAEKFIKTQDRAAEIEGERNIWFTVQHRDTGRFEHLGVKGYSGERLLKVINVIEALRGSYEGRYPHTSVISYMISIIDRSKVVDFSNPDSVDNLDVNEIFPHFHDQMVCQAFVVMKLKAEEIAQLNNYKRLNRLVRDGHAEIRDLEHEIQTKKESVKEVEREMAAIFLQE